MYSESGFLNLFERQWDGRRTPSQAFGQLDLYLRRLRLPHTGDAPLHYAGRCARNRNRPAPISTSTSLNPTDSSLPGKLIGSTGTRVSRK